MMKLINPKGMSEKQGKALRLCLGSSRLKLGREDLIASVAEGMANIEEGVRIIDQDLPVPRLGVVDLVAEDVRGRLVLMSFAERLDPELLGRSLIRSDWAVDNSELLGHMYSREFPSEVRCWQMVGSVSREAAALVSRLDCQPAEVFTCEGLELAGEGWLVVRRYDAIAGVREVMETAVGSIPERSVSAGSSVMKHPGESGAGNSMSMNSVLTREEIDDFFDASGYGEEVTSKVSNQSHY